MEQTHLSTLLYRAQESLFRVCGLAGSAKREERSEFDLGYEWGAFAEFAQVAQRYRVLTCEAQ